jgi:hypothetical protein
MPCMLRWVGEEREGEGGREEIEGKKEGCKEREREKEGERERDVCREEEGDGQAREESARGRESRHCLQCVDAV